MLFLIIINNNNTHDKGVNKHLNTKWLIQEHLMDLYVT